MALVPRTVSLLILLYQIRLLAAGLADTPVFAVALAGALLSAFFLYQRKIRPLEAVVVIALVPWVIRFLIALPRWFIPGVSNAAILFDSLLLNLDRNNFSAMLPFYWVAITSYFSLRSKIFLRADIIAADTLFLVLFSIAPTASIGAYRWPILMIAIFALVLFLQILSLVLSTPGELKIRRKEGIMAGAFLFVLIFLGGALFIRPFEKRAIEKGGGLLEPKLFRFDFSQVLKLESEISMNDDLVLIVKKDPEDYHILLRRYTLSGYTRKQGFFRLEETDETAHPQRLPNQRVILRHGEIENYRVSTQEYYIVNFDASAFIGMNMPVEVVPFEAWDASSFNSAYAVKSHTSEAPPFELTHVVRGEPEPGNLNLSPEEYTLYTEYGKDETIASFAREIIQDYSGRNAPSYWEQVQMIYDRLKYGEYRYSLKPGIAPNGDQLKYFLFDAKKGYCSYYAFAFTLMLRSLGIPSRVAAGFFVDPSTEAFNYYPVRTSMAHAWVEVWFPRYGWIEYDPTSQIMAEGEEFRFSQGTPPELFERLMKEILENRSRLREKEGHEAEGGRRNFAALGRAALKFFARNGLFLIAACMILLFLSIRSFLLWRSLLGKDQRKKALALWSHVKRRLSLAGLGKPAAAGEAEWAKETGSCVSGLYPLYLDAAAARFAPVYTAGDKLEMTIHYRLFSDEYRKAIPAWRRLLAWLLPPLALILKPSGKGAGSGGLKTAGVILIIVFLFSLRPDTAAQESPSAQADALYENAIAAQRAENWERAIELFSAGAKSYSWDFRFPWALGNLYYGRRLYRLAWDEYRRAERLIPWEPNLLLQLANTAGYLNINDASANYLEKVLAFEPDNGEAIGSLAWMYFKLHRLDEGERLLLEAMNRMGQSMDFSMTLGTIYSDMFRYREAKDSYLRAIQAAENSGDRLFAALAHYNLSILESRFYNFSLAFDSTNASLEAMNRASGRLARGELYLARMELNRALEEYQEAYGTDSSPLSKLNLAQVFQVGGRLSDAVLYASDCLKAGDDTWMLNYGIDPVRYKRDIHEILKDSYSGLLNAENFSCPGTLKEKVQSSFRKVSYRFYHAVHTHLFRKYSLLSANAYGGGMIHLEALLQYFNAFEAYRQRALSYLTQARNFEEPLIPGSAASYDFEESRLRKNRETLNDALGEFDPLWERDMISKVYAELALAGEKAERQDAAERLFALNRGALLQNGTRLPVELRFAEPLLRLGGILKRAAGAAGLEAARLDSPRYTLSFAQDGEGYISCELYDGGKGVTVWKQSLPSPGQKSLEKAAFARALRDGIFDPF
jgi:transglutaminase-like putative cysteine protease/predicted negative regulator of RcsB-dependent stress response